MNEQWQPIFGGIFEVSDCGKVRRSQPGIRNRKCIELKQQITQSGYSRVCLRLGTSTKNCFVHRLVAEAFLGPISDGLQVNHKDGNKLNNHLSNLECVTPKENSQHASMFGLKPSGDRHYTRVTPNRRPKGETLNRGHLTAQDIKTIRLLKSNGLAGKDIATRFGITPSTVSKITKLQAWSHVK